MKKKPLQSLPRRFLASFVKEITLPFSKLKSWPKTQQKQDVLASMLKSNLILSKVFGTAQ